MTANRANRQPPGTPLDTLSDILGVLPSVAPDGRTDTLVHPSGASGPPGVIASASSAAHPKIEDLSRAGRRRNERAADPRDVPSIFLFSRLLLVHKSQKFV